MTRTEGDALLAALAAIGPRPAIAWYGDEGRTELSGRVLGNWVIKAANHLGAEVGIAPGDPLVLDLPEHVKRLILSLAGWALGADVRIAPGRPGAAAAPGHPSAGGMRVVATDHPEGPLAADADELLVLEAVALSLRAPGPLPPLARDWAQELLGAGDALAVPLGPWSGPAPRPRDDGGRPVLVGGDGADGGADTARILAAWMAGGRVVAPGRAVDTAARRAEGVD